MDRPAHRGTSRRPRRPERRARSPSPAQPPSTSAASAEPACGTHPRRRSLPRERHHHVSGHWFPSDSAQDPRRRHRRGHRVLSAGLRLPLRRDTTDRERGVLLVRVRQVRRDATSFSCTSLPIPPKLIGSDRQPSDCSSRTSPRPTRGRWPLALQKSCHRMTPRECHAAPRSRIRAETGSGSTRADSAATRENAYRGTDAPGRHRADDVVSMAGPPHNSIRQGRGM